MSAKHTPGPAEYDSMGQFVTVENGWARLADIQGVIYREDGAETQDLNGRLVAAAYTSYDKHCGPRAVECAEADLLGEALDALRGAHECMRHRYGMEANDEIAFEKVRAVLAKVKP